jgi:hypothetical protein
MATTTTNFGWDIPQSTDLVKDGATAIAALGQDIDTAMVDLKGGTTGQVLAKASGTDLDFSWVAQDDSNAIQNAIVDAKGDLIGATAADTPARLAVGTNGQILTADSTAATGLAWVTPSSGAYTQIASQSLSGASQVNFSSISGTYNRLVLVVQDYYPNTSLESLCIRFNGDTTSGNYGVAGTSKGALNYTASGDTLINMNYWGCNNVDNNNMAVVEIENYTNTNSHKVVNYYTLYRRSPDDIIDQGAGRWKNTAAITEVNVRIFAGTFGGGTAILFGVK